MTIIMNNPNSDRPSDMLDQARELSESERERGVMEVLSAISGEGCDDCQDCGDQIPQARRDAAPWAVRCVGCQSDFEHTRA